MTVSQSELKEQVRDHVDAMSDHDFDRAAELYADDYTDEITRPTGEEIELDIERYKEKWNEYLNAFPDFTMELHEMAVEDDWVLARYTFSGTQEGEIFGIEPTGKEVEFQEHSSFRFEEGDVVEEITTGDTTGLLRQLEVDLPIER